MSQRIIPSISLLLFVVSGFSQSSFFNENASLEEKWQIGKYDPGEVDLLRLNPYKPFYVLLARRTNDVNREPSNDLLKVTEPLGTEPTEVAFQMSLKTRIARNAFGKRSRLDIWVGYTQTAHLQLYNTNISRPLRETNFEPEIILVQPLRYRLFGMKGSYVSMAFNHNSNGQSGELSRSWDRLIFETGVENEHWTILLRPWFRMNLFPSYDTNPDIIQFFGRGETVVSYREGRHSLSFRGRHALNPNKMKRGSLQLGYSYRMGKNFKVYAQLFHGYSESLIDYNHYQTTGGFGISFVEW